MWRDHVSTHQWDVRLHNYGLGETNRTILLSPADIRGQGTFGMKDSEAGGKIPLDIIEAATALKSLTGGGGKTAGLLHANCEGCEYELLESLIQAGLHWRIKTIQFGSHYFPQVPQLTQRYCAIREQSSTAEQRSEISSQTNISLSNAFQ